MKLTMKIDWNIYTFLIILVNQRGKFFQFSKKINILRFCLAFTQPKVTLLFPVDLRQNPHLNMFERIASMFMMAWKLHWQYFVLVFIFLFNQKNQRKQKEKEVGLTDSILSRTYTTFHLLKYILQNKKVLLTLHLNE